MKANPENAICMQGIQMRARRRAVPRPAIGFPERHAGIIKKKPVITLSVVLGSQDRLICLLPLFQLTVEMYRYRRVPTSPELEYA